MFIKVKEFFKSRTSRPGDEDLADQIRQAERLRDMVGVAYKLDLPVKLLVEVNGVNQGIMLAGTGPESEWIYNFACSQVLAKKARAKGLALEEPSVFGGVGRL